MSETPTVVVVGAGPAGIAAARVLAEAGVRPMLLDEAPSPGGQIWKRARDGLEPTVAKLPGMDVNRATEARRALERLAARVDYYPGATVLDVTAAELWALAPSGEVDRTSWDRLLVCCGALDRIVPVPGWTMPGVYTLGGAQTALKQQGMAVGRGILFAGTGPLLHLAAAQHVAAGAGVVAVVDTARTLDGLAALDDLVVDRARLGLGFRCRSILRRSGIPIVRRVGGLRIEGSARVEMVSVEVGGSTRTFACDSVALGFGLVPQIQLLDLLEVPMRVLEPSGIWVPEVDRAGRTPVPRVYAAGDGVSIRGAEAAELSGERAALAILEDLGHPTEVERTRRLERRLARHDRFARGLARAFPFPVELEARVADPTVVCRCEEVTAGRIRAAVREQGADDVNRAKALSRVGMGRCQGRLCCLAAARIVAVERGIPLAEAGRLRTQPPIKPLPVSAISAQSEIVA